LYKKYIKEPTQENRTRFVTYRNKFKKVRKDAERQYYASKILECENDLSKTWGVIKSLLHGNEFSSLPDTFFIDNIEIKEKNIIANKFNDFFTEIGPQLAAKIPNTDTTFRDFLKSPSASSIGIELTSPAELKMIARSSFNTQ
jgi:hypothetical protein